MKIWEELLGIPWPDNQCDRSGECCRGAAQIAPWKTTLKSAAQGDTTSRNFLNQFQPYSTQDEARKHAPDAVSASLETAQKRGDEVDSVVFYRCVYLKNQSDCQIYEDRPTLCRDFPESPFGAIPSCCGYAKIASACLAKADALRQELADLKKLKNALEQNRFPAQQK